MKNFINFKDKINKVFHFNLDIKKALIYQGFFYVFYLSYFGGSRNATAKKRVTSANVRISV